MSFIGNALGAVGTALGGPVGGLVGNVVGGLFSSNASDNATNAQQNATNQANATQLQIYNQNRADQAPWRSAGESALNTLMATLGLPTRQSQQGQQQGVAQQGAQQNTQGPQAQAYPNDPWQFHRTAPVAAGTRTVGTQAPGIQAPMQYPSLGGGRYATAQFTPGDLRNEPGYQFLLSEGQRGIDNSAAARGGIGGDSLRAAANFSQGLAGTTYNDAFNRFQTERGNTLNPLFQIAGFGPGANAQNAASGQNYANQYGANVSGAGNAQAVNAQNQGNIWGNVATNAFKQFAMPNSPVNTTPSFPGQQSFGTEGWWM